MSPRQCIFLFIQQLKLNLPFTSALEGSGLSSAFLEKSMVMYADQVVRNKQRCLNKYCRPTTVETTPLKVPLCLREGRGRVRGLSESYLSY